MQTEGYHVKAPEKDVHVLGRQREKKGQCNQVGNWKKQVEGVGGGRGRLPPNKNTAENWGVYWGAADEEEVASDWPQRPTALHTRAGRLSESVCVYVCVCICVLWGGHAFL